MTNRISTEPVEPHRRLDFWQSTVSSLYAPVEIQDCETATFESEIVSAPLDHLMISRFDGARQTIARPKSLIHSGHCDDYVAVVQLGGVNHNATNGHETVTARDSITLYDLARPYELNTTERLGILDVSIPRADFEHVFGPTNRAVGLSIDPQQPSASIICAFFRNLMERGHLLDPSTAARMASIGVDLLAAGFAERMAVEPRHAAGSATIVYRAKALMEQRLSDQSLSVSSLAAMLQLSVRRLHEVFAQQELTVEGYLWERRLTKASLWLRDQASGAVPIANIGYSVGFTSPAHFARRFRQRFGMTPSTYRDLARIAEAVPH